MAITLLIIAGIMNANFSLPMKFTRKWKWENIWIVWTLWALVIMPLATAYLTIPNFGTVYALAGIQNIIWVAFCGLGWGVSQLLFGVAIDLLGIALAFAIVLGISAAVGSFLPLIWLHPDKIFAPAGLDVMAGVGLVLLGVWICAVAGRKREEAVGAQHGHKPSLAAGLTCAILSGLGAAAMNLGLALGGALLQLAKSMGADPVSSINAVWVPLLLAGAVPNLIYCAYLVRKNDTLEKFSAKGTYGYWVAGGAMAFLWFASALMYGVASSKLGELGPVLGWPVFMSLIVISATAVGYIMGEWKNAGKIPLRIQIAGIIVLVLAVIVLSRAGTHIA